MFTIPFLNRAATWFCAKNSGRDNGCRPQNRQVIRSVLVSTLMLWGSATVQSAGSLDAALKEQRKIQQEAARSQARIDAVDDESQALLEEFRTAREGLENLQGYNAQMSRMVEAQEIEAAELEQQLQGIEVTKQGILPLMVRMVEVLEQFVDLDRPFLAGERSLRLKGLKELLDDPQVGLAEKYRRILEAYRVENAYGYSIETYTDELALGGRVRMVDFLRLGRVGLYYMTFDKTEAGYWDAASDKWMPLDASYLDALEQGIRIARKQAPPDLIRLPVPAPQAAL